MYEITEINPRWNHKWANDPDVEVTVSEDITKTLEWLYRKVPEDADKNYWLISTNNFPWVRFVYVANPDGRPQDHGALGGDYKLEDGTILHTNTGWSSRPSVYNRDFAENVGKEVVDVRLRVPGWYSAFAGFYINGEYLEALDKFPRNCYMVRISRPNGETRWVISSTPNKVVKPDEET